MKTPNSASNSSTSTSDSSTYGLEVIWKWFGNGLEVIWKWFGSGLELMAKDHLVFNVHQMQVHIIHLLNGLKILLVDDL